ncbi:helix-turn-helix transcriptional regulator [Planctomycetota bacterium]
MKRQKIDRLLQLITTLQTGQCYSVDGLAEMFKVSRRTVFRDLKNLQKAGIPCYYDNKNHSYRIDSEFFMPPQDLTVPEALSLFLLVYKLKDCIDLPLGDLALKAALKIESNLPEKTKRYCNSVLANISVKARPRTRKNISYELFTFIQQAILKKQIVNVRYNSISKKKTVTFDLYPHHILFNENKWYVIGKSSTHKDMRSFRLDQIAEVKIRNKCFVQDRDFDISNYIGRAWLMLKEGRLHNVKLRFVPEIASEVASSQWHKTQTVTFEDDGSAIIEFRIDGLDEITPWILSYGDQVKVIKPESLRQRIYATAIAISNFTAS